MEPSSISKYTCKLEELKIEESIEEYKILSNMSNMIFDNIFISIGDNQSVQNSLSTFSSHVKELSEIIKLSNKSTLLLFDEIGSGTEPNEGAAL